MPAVTAADLILPPPAEGSREVAARVARARDDAGRALCGARPAAHPHQRGGAGAACSRRSRSPDNAGLTLLRDAADAMRLSARGYHRVLRVARTLADLDGAEESAACISPRRCPTARSPTRCDGRLDNLWLSSFHSIFLIGLLVFKLHAIMF